MPALAPPDTLRPYLDALSAALETPGERAALRVAYPFAGAVFPPEFIAPTFQWTDSSRADAWLIECRSADGGVLRAVTRSPPLPAPAIDSATIPTRTKMVIPDPNRFRNWSPGPELWEIIKRRSVEKKFAIRIHGFRAEDPPRALSSGEVVFTTSRDSVLAPIFYRDVPIMPNVNKTGRVQPLSTKMQSLIKWSLRDVSRRDNKTIIEDLPSCANCHSFSRDGRRFGLDLDGPQSDKGSYGLAEVADTMDIGRRDMFSWNYDFKGRKPGKRSIGFLSQVSPDGEFVATTLNEELYIQNFMNNDYLQAFFPTRGVLACYSKRSGRIKLLPGADSAAYVHCDPSWSPDGKWIVFARAPAKDSYRPGQPESERPDDSNETRIQYGLYKIPFNGGRGGRAEPIVGAHDDGMSNSFPKVSPDGKRIVFVKARNGQVMRPDGRLWMVPFEGGEARLMACNLPEMNSWHSFSPTGRWMVFSSKGLSYYTQMFLTHIGEDGMDSPPVLIPGATAANRAVNLPEFANIRYDDLDKVTVSAVQYIKTLADAKLLLDSGRVEDAKAKMRQALEEEKQDGKYRSEVQTLLGWLLDSLPERIALTREGIKSHPGNFMAHANLASLLEKQGRMKEALRSYHDALKIEPDNPWVLASLANFYLQNQDTTLRNPATALEYAEKSNVEAKYREPSILKTLARCYSEAGRFEDAIRSARTGLDLARQQGLSGELQELETEITVYEHGKSFLWALKDSQRR